MSLGSWLKGIAKETVTKAVVAALIAGITAVLPTLLQFVILLVQRESVGTPSRWLPLLAEAAISTVADVSAHPFRWIAFILLTLGWVILVAVLGRAHRRLRAQSDKLKQGDLYDGLLNRSGLNDHWPHAKSSGDGGAPWSELCSEIIASGSFVSILGANGLDTFGRRGAPLYDTLEKFGGQVRVVLAHPRSDHTKGRAESLDMTPDEYRAAIGRSRDRLRELVREGHHIEGRYYDSPPNWKMIATARGLWLQYYEPGGRHVEDTDVFRFNATGRLYRCFIMEFDRIWDRCKANPMNLTDETPDPPARRRTRW